MALEKDNKQAGGEGTSPQPRRGDAAAPGAAPRAAAETASSRRLKYGLSVGILLLSLLLILGVLNWLASDAARRIDLTAVGRYSLSAQTMRILDGLEETVTVTTLFAESDPLLSSDEQRALAAQRRQIEDVLREFRNKSGKIEVVRIDPVDPRTITKYDALVEQLSTIFAGEIETYRSAIDAGRAQMVRAGEFAGPQAEPLINALGDLAPEHASFRTFQTIIQVFSIIPREMESIGARVDEAMSASTMRGTPFADLEGAASIVRAALQLRGATMNQVAEFFEQSVADDSLPQTLRDHLASLAPSCRDVGGAMLDQQEALDDLPTLKLTPISIALRQRNCVLVSTPTRASVLPYDRLFRAPGAQEALDEGAGAVRRFAGETVIASGIRQMLLDERPNVILCHAQPQPSILTGALGGVDFGAVADLLSDLGFYVREWNVNIGPRPDVSAQATGEPVWVIVPPPPSAQSMMPAAALVDAATQLVAEGANVMIGFFPRLVPGLGQRDQWNAVIEPLGVEADTDRLIVEQIPAPGGVDQFAHSHEVVEFLGEHPVAAAVRGLPTRLDYAVPLKLLDDSQAERTVLVEIKPTDRIWATNEFLQMPIPPPAVRDTEPYRLVVAVERPQPSGAQRALLLGSSQWCYSAVVQEGDLRFRPPLPYYPGNAELFTSGVCWLAHLDELIARSPRAQSVERIENLGRGAQIFWRWALIGGLPVLSLAAGVAVALARRG